ncbi:MAG TPA: hypothetical protein VFR58_00755 [Flavisolibacter sp.]|nr:hypothetical protein [Flavisolibacter sp.]
MKKFFGILAIAGVLVACNNSGEGTTGSDTATGTGDTTTMNQMNTGGDTTNTLTPGVGDTSTRTGDTSTLNRTGDTTRTK